MNQHIHSLYETIQASIRKKDIVAGRNALALVKSLKLESSSFLGTHLIRLFDAFGSLLEAKQVFSKIFTPNVFAWTAIISAHAKFGESDVALALYCQLLWSKEKPDKHAFVASLKACSNLLALEEGRLVHSHTLESGTEADVCVGSVLIDMYAKCKTLNDAQQVFDSLQNRDVVPWNALITGYAQHGQGADAFKLSVQMQQEGIQMSNASYLSFLKACCCIISPAKGAYVHISIIENGFEYDILVYNTLIDMYVKCGRLEMARRAFNIAVIRDVVTWNVMISGYAQNGNVPEMLSLFDQMDLEGIHPNNVTWNSMISGLVQCGQYEAILHLQRKMQDEGLEPNVVTWNVLISGLVQHGHGEAAFHLFQQMLHKHIEPINATFVGALKACSIMAARSWGTKAHAFLVELGYEMDIFVASTLIDMYANCGNLRDAYSVFWNLPNRNVVSWSALIDGYVKNKKYKIAFQFFEIMQSHGVKPNEVTFVSILSACSHAGLVSEGYHFFVLMQEVYGIAPMLEHFNCMVELLGVVGHLLEAERLLLTIPFQGNITGWTSLLNHCRQYQDIKLGLRCFNHAAAMDFKHASLYVMMSNIYNDAGMWDNAEVILARKRSVFSLKTPGKALIEIDGHVQNFTVGESCYLSSEQTYKKLNMLDAQIRDRGFIPHRDFT